MHRILTCTFQYAPLHHRGTDHYTAEAQMTSHMFSDQQHEMMLNHDVAKQIQNDASPCSICLVILWHFMLCLCANTGHAHL